MKVGMSMAKLNEKKMVNDIRMIALDMIDNANSGHPGIVLSAAPIMYTLFANHLNFDLDREDYINEQIENSQDIISITDHNKEIPTDNSSPLTQRITLGVITACVTSPSINSIAASAAAFVPPQSMKTKGHIAKRTKKSSRIIGLQDRLNKLLNQIE